MKFKYTGPNRRDKKGREWPARVYCGHEVLNGETFELEDDFFIQKALNNPHCQQVKPRGKAAKKDAKTSNEAS